jgi:hypothetical protein
VTRQIHGRLTDEQAAAILSRYVKKELTAEQAMDMLGLGRSQFFEWVKKYKNGLPADFSIGYGRTAPNRRIGSDLETAIAAELQAEKALIDDPSIPVRSYNYTFVKDQIFKKHQQEVSVPTIIDRAKKTAFTSPSRKGSTMTGKSLPITWER